ncbi:MAG: CoA transferase subunit A, partial [Anaerolineae bacterium]|nr:CoA transferase subunit A [Anaerolineae bacterium]
ALGIRATLGGVGFLPSRAWLGTDLLALRPDVKTVRDPYSDEELVAFPAITCDVAVIHALVADRFGNVRLNKNWAIDRELAFLAETVIVTAEEVVERLDDDVDIPAPFPTLVVPAPRGAWPTSCHPAYPVDGLEILRYTEACAAGRFDEYLAEFLAAS